MERRIDLHTHSTASDGTDSPAQVVEKASRASLAAVALTDHDTIAGLAEAREAANDLGVELIAGCEISTRADYGSMHVLGLWLPENSSELKGFLAKMRGIREERNRKMVDKLRKLGFDISMEELMAEADGAVGRPHLAKLMEKKGYATLHEAFTKYLGSKGGLAYVPKEAMRPEEAVRLLSRFGATVSLAHPLLRDLPRDWLASQVAALVPCGLDALEAWHSKQDESQSEWLVNLARANGLGISGGSDYHGSVKPDIQLGRIGPGKYVPIDVLNNLKKTRKQKGLPC